MLSLAVLTVTRIVSAAVERVVLQRSASSLWLCWAAVQPWHRIMLVNAAQTWL